MACMDCHDDDEEERFEGMLASWSREVDQLLNDAEARADERATERLRTLRRAGPLHNIKATRLLVQAIMRDSE